MFNLLLVCLDFLNNAIHLVIWCIRAANSASTCYFWFYVPGLSAFCNFQEGKQYGDEYLAELDFIEVAESRKQGYESDVEDPDYLIDNNNGTDEEDDENAFQCENIEGSTGRLATSSLCSHSLLPFLLSSCLVQCVHTSFCRLSFDLNILVLLHFNCMLPVPGSISFCSVCPLADRSLAVESLILGFCFSVFSYCTMCPSGCMRRARVERFMLRWWLAEVCSSWRKIMPMICGHSESGLLGKSLASLLGIV